MDTCDEVSMYELLKQWDTELLTEGAIGLVWRAYSSKGQPRVLSPPVV